MKIAIAYSHSATKTSQAAKHISKAWGSDDLVSINVEDANAKDLTGFDLVIAGVPTWFDGELPHYWDEMVSEIEEHDYSNTKFAIFGLGNQVEYPENFCDGIGLLSDVFKTNGGSIIGYTSIEGYEFERSMAQEGDQFCGLALDFETQSSENTDRIKNWVEQIKKEIK